MPTFDPSDFINKKPIEIKEEVYEAKHTFKTFGLDSKIEKNVSDMGLEIPTPIQDKIIPEILEGKDVIGLAETGTGKTAAFLLPLIHRTLKDPNQTTLILAPTRELAIQIQTEARKLSESLKLYSTVCVGGTSITPQLRLLKKTNHFIIGTPGRVLDLFNRKAIKFHLIKTVVLDEADRMLDMGFINDMKKILSLVPREKSTLLFSATIDKRTEEIVKEFQKDPVMISVKKKESAESVEQDVVSFKHSSKFESLTSLFDNPEFDRVIVFGSMKHSVQALADKLNKSGIKSESIHGNKNHNQRQRSLANFKEGRVKVLVATDVAARGIHVDNVSHVINYDLPNTREDYIHRIGRTGRGNEKGKALTFIEKKF